MMIAAFWFSMWHLDAYIYKNFDSHLSQKHFVWMLLLVCLSFAICFLAVLWMIFHGFCQATMKTDSIETFNFRLCKSINAMRIVIGEKLIELTVVGVSLLELQHDQLQFCCVTSTKCTRKSSNNWPICVNDLCLFVWHKNAWKQTKMLQTIELTAFVELQSVPWMAMNGHKSPWMAINGYEWQRMAMNGHEWPWMTWFFKWWCWQF